MRISVLALALTLAAASPYASFAATATPAVTAQGILAYTNAERIKIGLPAYTSNTLLSRAAARKMTDLFARQYFAHVAPTGEDVSVLVKDTGYTYLVVGENLALGDFASSKALVTAWMNSPGHKANILSKAFTEIGIAAGESNYKGRKVWIGVQSFGLPRSACPVVDPLMRAKIDASSKTLTMLDTIAKLREAAYKTAVSTHASNVQTLADSYNLVAKLYNERATSYRVLVIAFNKEVDASNACIKEKTSTVKPVSE
jgi:uncharacterized protein YkwD